MTANAARTQCVDSTDFLGFNSDNSPWILYVVGVIFTAIGAALRDVVRCLIPPLKRRCRAACKRRKLQQQQQQRIINDPRLASAINEVVGMLKEANANNGFNHGEPVQKALRALLSHYDELRTPTDSPVSSPSRSPAKKFPLDASWSKQDQRQELTRSESETTAPIHRLFGCGPHGKLRVVVET